MHGELEGLLGVDFDTETLQGTLDCYLLPLAELHIASTVLPQGSIKFGTVYKVEIILPLHPVHTKCLVQILTCNGWRRRAI
jgi:hypothetical protein